jgi:hypothetical protein
MTKAPIIGNSVCSNCKHALQRDDDAYFCRRYPPTVQMFPLIGVNVLAAALGVPGAQEVAQIPKHARFYPITMYPTVQTADTCGEWSTKIERVN